MFNSYNVILTTMKLKALIIAAAAVLTAATASARDTYSHDPVVLPSAASELIAKHFPKAKVSHIKIDNHTFGGKDYDVVLTDGTEIDFDSNGNLKDVDCGRYGKVPSALVPENVRNYVKRTYPKSAVVKIDVKRNGYEVELQSGVELEFDRQGNFKRIDR